MSAPTSTPGKDPVAFDPNYEYNAPKFRDFLVPSPPDAEYESYFNSTQPSQLTPPGAASSSGVTPAIAAMSAAGSAGAPAEVQKQINFDDAEAPAPRPAAAAAAAVAAAAPAASAAALADALISAMPAIPPTPAKPVSEAQAALPPFKHTESAASAAPAAAASSSSAAAAAAKASKSERKSVDGRGVNKAPLKKRRMSAAPAAASSGARTRSVSATRKAALPAVARGKSPAKPVAAAAAAAPAAEPSTARGRSRSRTKSDAGAELSKALAGTKRKSVGGAELAAAAATPRARSRSSTRPAAAAAAAAITAGSSSARASSRRSMGAAAAAPAAAAAAEPTARGRARARASMGSASAAAAAATPRSGSASARSRSASREKSLDRSMSDRALTARSSTATPSRASSRTRTSLGASASAGKLTVAASPKLRTKSRTRGGAHEKSTEDAEMEAIEKGRAELQKRRKLNEAAVAAVLSEVGSVLPVRSTKSLTEPQEFHFSTDERLGKKKAEPKATPKRTPLKASASVPAITVPAPFHFECDKRIKGTAEDVKPFVPLAAGVESFLKAPREAPVPIAAAAGAGMSSSASVPTLTQPKEFQFRTDARHRDPKILSTAEREEQEMAALKPFKAAPLNEKVMHSNGELGVPKVKKPATTVPKEFHFATAEKAAEHAAKEAERAAAGAAKPVAYLLQQHPEIAVEEEAMLKARKEAAEKAAEERVFSSLAPKPPTVPMSPNITKPNPKKRKTPSPPGKYQFKARDMPDATPFKPDYAQAKPATAPVPFALATDERGAAKEQKFIATLEKEAEEARRAREFKAQQIGEGVPVAATGVAVVQKPLTEPKPFELESVRRAEAHRQALAKQMEEEMAKENAMFSSFKARDLPAELAVPFVPKKSGAPLTELAPFQLASDVRSEQRSEFDTSKADRQAKAAAAQALRAAEIAAAEAAAVKQLRASMVHKALPILAVDQPFAPAPAAVAPTVPMSPPLATKARAQSGLRASTSVASLAR